MDGVSRRTTPLAEATHHWYDPVVSVVNTVVRRLQTVEWATGWRSRFTRDLPGVASPLGGSSYSVAAAQLNNAGYQVSETTIAAFLNRPRSRAVRPSSLSSGDIAQLEGMGLENVGKSSRPRSFVLYDRLINTALSRQLSQAVDKEGFVQTDLMGHGSEIARGVLDEGKPLIFIPVIQESEGARFEARHIVWITVDTKSREIEYYDPKGLPMKGTAAEEVLKGLRDYQTTLESYSVVENRFRHQYDTHNCGVFGLAYAEARIEGVTFAYYNRFFYKDIERVRQEMANTMKAHAAQQPAEGGTSVVNGDGFVEL